MPPKSLKKIEHEKAVNQEVEELLALVRQRNQINNEIQFLLDKARIKREKKALESQRRSSTRLAKGLDEYTVMQEADKLLKEAHARGFGTH